MNENHAQGAGLPAHIPLPQVGNQGEVASTKNRFVCPDCGEIFDRKFNLQRHFDRKVKCTKKTDVLGQKASARLMCTVLDVLRGPLSMSEQQAKDDSFVVSILSDLWQAVALAAEHYPKRAFTLVHRLIVEQLNVRQVILLFSVVLSTMHPPKGTMINTLRSLYSHLYMNQQHEDEGDVKKNGTNARRRISAKLQGMWLLQALRE